MPDCRRRERRGTTEGPDRLRYDGHCCSHRLTDVRSTHRSTGRPAHRSTRFARHSRDLRRTVRVSGAPLDREPATSWGRRPRDGRRLGHRRSTGSEAGPLFLRLRRGRVRPSRASSGQSHSTGARLCVLAGDSARSTAGRLRGGIVAGRRIGSPGRGRAVWSWNETGRVTTIAPISSPPPAGGRTARRRTP